jgi:undecaprenyl-diphosphatase
VTATSSPVAWPRPGRRERIAAGELLVVSLTRIHVGAHLRLDVAGGVGLGLAVGGVVRLALGWLS